MPLLFFVSASVSTLCVSLHDRTCRVGKSITQTKGLSSFNMANANDDRGVPPPRAVVSQEEDGGGAVTFEKKMVAYLLAPARPGVQGGSREG